MASRATNAWCRKGGRERVEMKASRKNREVGGRTKTKTTMATKERKLNGGSMEERETEREREVTSCKVFCQARESTNPS